MHVKEAFGSDYARCLSALEFSVCCFLLNLNIKIYGAVILPFLIDVKLSLFHEGKNLV